jgi:hypothetical protein
VLVHTQLLLVVYQVNPLRTSLVQLFSVTVVQLVLTHLVTLAVTVVVVVVEAQTLVVLAVNQVTVAHKVRQAETELLVLSTV